MTEERILVQREGTFHYPIVFRKDFSSLSEEVLSLSKKAAVFAWFRTAM